jgi:Tol biopolymer transport system component
VFDVGAGNPIGLTGGASGVLDGYPSWLPDGSQIAFHRFYLSQNREEIWVMGSDGSNQHWIGIEGGSAKWSPDGVRLIYHSVRGDSYDLFVCSADGTDEDRLTSTSSGELSPAWSPDGRRVAFTFVDSNINHHVFVMDLDGANLHEVAEGGAPQWSPDGSLLAVHRDGEIFVMGADGTGQRQVTNSAHGTRSLFPAWRPGIP